MKRTLKAVVSTTCLVIVVMALTSMVFAAGPNYAHSDEWWTELGFTGYIQCRASYYDSQWGGHVAYGQMWYTNTQNNGPFSTATAYGPTDTYTYTRTQDVWDLFDPFAPSAEFYSYFFIF